MIVRSNLSLASFSFTSPSPICVPNLEAPTTPLRTAQPPAPLVRGAQSLAPASSLHDPVRHAFCARRRPALHRFTRGGNPLSAITSAPRAALCATNLCPTPTVPSLDNVCCRLHRPNYSTVIALRQRSRRDSCQPCGSASLIRSRAISAYTGFNSIPTKRRSCIRETTPVVQPYRPVIPKNPVDLAEHGHEASHVLVRGWL
jgi:hypothetical protein